MPSDIAQPPKIYPPREFVPEEARRRSRLRRVFDAWARRVVTTGGFAIIASILAILVFLFIEILPLFQPAEVSPQETLVASDFLGPAFSEIVALGVEENQEVGYAVTRAGWVRFFPLEADTTLGDFQLNLETDEALTASWQSLDGRRLVSATNQGRVYALEVDYNSRFYEGRRDYSPEIAETAAFALDTAGVAVQRLAFAGDPEGSLAVGAMTASGDVLLYFRQQETSLFGDVEIDSARYVLAPIWSGRPTRVALDGNMRNLYLGSDDGKIYHWRVASDQQPQFVSVVRANGDGAAVTALDFLIGDRSLLAGDARGRVSIWFLVRDNTSVVGHRLTRIHRLRQHPAPVVFFAPSPRRKGFISADEKGGLYLQYATSERFLAEFQAPTSGPIRYVTFAPKANGALVLDHGNRLSHWVIDNPHPEASFKAFFGKVWYEGYDRPEYVWQSTGGTDDFEPKLSLVPLIFGSFKGTLYALLFAIPLAIFGALYTSQFMHPSMRNYVKPTIELMAALPSVVLGFLAGLWLAPRIEQIIPGVLLMFLVFPPVIILSALIWRSVPQRFRGRFGPGTESVLLVPVVVLAIWLCIELSQPMEALFFGGDFKVWLYDHFNMTYDQRNALVVGIAMGFAVIPIIYTISEDALSNVPNHLISGSLAMGATRWQTAVKVVLPTAAAGIFSAIMIGFGRAVGETMIVLMATGNTPIMDWNIFNGFRTLSANIAVEIPEAPVGGTLYRTLFVSALLLFVITFLVNTLAEVVRQRLRERYQKL